MSLFIITIYCYHLCFILFITSLLSLYSFHLLSAAIEKGWRTALIVISSTLLLLPIAIGSFQIFCKGSGGISHSMIDRTGIDDYYRIVNSARNNKKTDDLEP